MKPCLTVADINLLACMQIQHIEKKPVNESLLVDSCCKSLHNKLSNVNCLMMKDAMFDTKIRRSFFR